MNTSPKKRMDGIRPKTKKNPKLNIKKEAVVPQALGTQTKILKKPKSLGKSSRRFRRISVGEQRSGRKEPFSLHFFVKNNWSWLRYTLVPFLVVIAFFLITESQTHASLSVSPHVEGLALSDTIRVYKNPPQNALGFDIIAVTNEESLPLAANGVELKNTKAQGRIIIYNDYGPETQTLSKGTRFLSSDNKLFFLVGDAVSVPGKTGDTPGALEVEVTAEHEGPHYNIEATRFSIPGFKEAGLEEKFSTIYAVSDEKIQGGFVGSEPSVLASDRQSAEETLQQKLTDKLRMRLSKENNDTVLIVANSAALRLQSPLLHASDDSQAATLTQKGTLVALALSHASLAQYLEKNYIKPDEDELIHVVSTQGLNVSLAEQNLDFTQDLSQAVIAISGEIPIEWGINEDLLSEKIQDKKIEELSFLFEKTKSVDKVELDVFPPWKKRIPHDKNRIHIYVD